MTFGFSRDDIGGFLPDYLKDNILEADPFQTIDQQGVGQLIKMAVEKGRGTKHDLKVGICGEQGGDPASVEFCFKTGLNYVSCSPYRVPIARLAAAHAAIKAKEVSLREISVAGHPALGKTQRHAGCRVGCREKCDFRRAEKAIMTVARSKPCKSA